MDGVFHGNGDSMYILVGADFVPTQSNIEQFKKADMEALLSPDLMNCLSQAAYRIFNLEVPLTDTAAPIIKLGPSLIAPTDTIAGYSSIKVDLLTLANNHILDQGDQGLRSTLKTLNGAGIAHIGAGNDLNEAKKPYVFSFSGKRVGVYACAEHEFSIATDDTAGANPFDPLWSLEHVEELKRVVDYVIVLYHGGKEHYRYPSPNLQKICRRFVDKGADLVICQHSHCIGCEEKYNGGTIVYGQGNFLFDNSDSEYWQTSLITRINEHFEISYIPLRKAGKGVTLASDKDRILSEFKARGEEIKDPVFIKKEYDIFANKTLNGYLQTLCGKESLLFRGLNKIFKGRLRKRRLARLYDNKRITAILNYIECEAHNELLVTGLRRESDELERAQKGN